MGQEFPISLRRINWTGKTWAATLYSRAPAAGKAFDYVRHAANIWSETRAELNKTAELEIAETNSKIMTMVNALATSAATANPGAHPKEPTGKAATKSGLAAVA